MTSIFLRRAGLSTAAALLFVLLASLPSIAILFRDGTMAGFDIQYHTVSFAQFVKQMHAGDVLPRWAPDMGGGYGYPNFLFQPPLVYLLALPAHAAGLTYAESLDVVIGFAMLASAVGMFLFARHCWGTRAGVVAAITYVYAPYHLVTAYIKGAVPELLGMALWPFALWFWTRCLERGRRADAAGFAVVFALLLFTNHLSSLMLAGMCVASAAAHVWASRLRASRSASTPASPSQSPSTSNPATRRGIVLAGIAFAVGLALGAWMWVPAYFERGDVAIGLMTQGYFDYARHFASVGRLLYSRWGYDPAGYADPFTLMIGVLQVAAFVLAIVGWRHHRDPRVAGLALIVLASSLLTLPVSSWLWAHVGLLRAFQFPWRFVAPAMFAASALVGWATVAFGPAVARRAAPLAIAAALVLGAPHALPKARIFRDPGFAEPAMVPAWTFDWIGSDVTHFYAAYLPVQAVLPSHARIAPAQLGDVRASGEWNDFRIVAPHAGVLRVETFWYPGWQLYVDGRPVAARRERSHGLIETDLPAGAHRVQLEWGDTTTRRLARWLSWLGLAVCALMLMPRRRVTTRRDKDDVRG